MLIEKNISSCCNQELIINFMPYLDISMTIGAWQQGLHFLLKKKGQFIEQDTHARLILVTKQHLSNKNLPIYHFLQQIPQWIREKVKSYRHYQLLLLQVLSTSQRAREIFIHSPNLLWLLVIEKNTKQWTYKIFEEVLALKRHIIIEKIFPLKNTSTMVTAKQQLKFINKMSFTLVGIKDYQVIQNAMVQSKIIDHFKHYSAIPIQLLVLLEHYPEFIGCQFLKSELLLSHKTIINNIREYKTTADYIGDIKRMAKILSIKNIPSQYRKKTSQESLQKMHDKLVDRINKHPVLKTEYEKGFPKPDIQGNDDIVFISNVYELKKEGRELQHCVASYTEVARKGHRYFYKILEPQRGTLEITLQKNTYVINSFKLKHNNEPSKQSWKKVRIWLKQQNKQLEKDKIWKQ